ncbi:hypothetical protein [Calderihabitans maritimus]|uniref:Uncharacterized protein n=1 Tax=Calderihabitans maritimus TaxID=1246530 RepID=A0A1Z5HPZ1_9FIRM|nr:hypothetical protein [Calderihabitans maritimus]GAW91381.1 hypothetical protein KKC1_05430 [Calderihabitans maritimus]
MAKRFFSLFIILIIVDLLSGCTAGVQNVGNIPIYPNAELVRKTEQEVTFLVNKASLSLFKKFYKKKMPLYGWKLIDEGAAHLTYTDGKREVVITYSFPRPPFEDSVILDTYTGRINAFSPKNPSPLIRIIYLTSKDE